MVKTLTPKQQQMKSNEIHELALQIGVTTFCNNKCHLGSRIVTFISTFGSLLLLCGAMAFLASVPAHPRL
jgi:hypothetical protein